MLLRNLTIRTGQQDTPAVVLEIPESGGSFQVPQPWAAAVPRYLLSLVCPEEMSLTDLARLSGSSSEAAWRANFQIGQRIVRLSRSFAAHSVRMELQDGDTAQWQTVAAGVAEVKQQLLRLTEVPPVGVLDALTFVLNPLPKGTVAEADAAGASAMQVESNNDYAEVLGAKRSVPLPTTPEDTARICDEYRRARTSELLEDQIRTLQDKLDEHAAAMARLIDNDGELSRIAAEIARQPRLRPLTDAEREALSQSDDRIADLRRRTEAAQDEVKAFPTSRSRVDPLIIGQALFGFGLMAFVGLTFWAFSSMQRGLLVVNVLPLSVALFGALQWIQVLQQRALVAVRGDAADRRQQRLEQELLHLTRTREALRRELGVSSFEEYEAIGKRLERLQARERKLMEGRESETQTPEYQKALRKKERLEGDRDERRRALSRIEASRLPSYELQATLEDAGLDPSSVLWFPGDVTSELRQAGKRLASAAQEQGMMPDGKLQSLVLEAWQRLAARIGGDAVQGIQLTTDGGLVSGTRADLNAQLSPGKCWALLEALRVSLLLNLINSGSTLPGFMVRVHPLRLNDVEAETALTQIYSGVGRKVQLIQVTAE